MMMIMRHLSSAIMPTNDLQKYTTVLRYQFDFIHKNYLSVQHHTPYTLTSEQQK